MELSFLMQENTDDKDAEARVNAIKGLVSVCETLTKARKFSTTEEDTSLYLMLKHEVMQTLFRALTDYSVDNRGDVGSWVREAAMDALERCTYILCERQSLGFPENTDGSDSLLKLPSHGNVNHDTALFDESVATTLVGGLVKQAVEKMDKIRVAATKVLQRILFKKDIFVPCIPHRKKLEKILTSEADSEWVVCMHGSLHLPCYLRYR